MSTKFFEELIGKVCEITLRDDENDTATLLSVDGDWLKFHDDYGQTIYVNAEHLISLSVTDEKDDRESRWNRRKNRNPRPIGR